MWLDAFLSKLRKTVHMRSEQWPGGEVHSDGIYGVVRSFIRSADRAKQ